jgi:PAS domain-containing protein
MQEQRSLVLILARDLADKLASAVFLVDAEGTLVYFNETAADILGQPFSAAGSMSLEEWSTAFRAVTDGRELDAEELPLVQALRHQRPAHTQFRITSMDGDSREIAVTALPLFARADEFVGAVAFFWEHGA